MCKDPSVLGRTFYIMGFVDGWSPMALGGWAAPYDSDPRSVGAWPTSSIDGIVEMGKVDWQGKGLGDLGRPDGFHDRQVERWTRFLERIRGREIPGLDEATAWLSTHRPLDFVPGIMHGDYQFANVMFRNGTPARLAAIIDWEMGTVGDPKLDLGWAPPGLARRHSVERGEGGYVDITGMPGRSELLAFYAERSGRQVDDFDYYLVLASWKLAIVLEQGFQRAAGDPKLEAFGAVVLDNMARAAELAAVELLQGHGHDRVSAAGSSDRPGPPTKAVSRFRRAAPPRGRRGLASKTGVVVGPPGSPGASGGVRHGAAGHRQCFRVATDVAIGRPRRTRWHRRPSTN